MYTEYSQDRIFENCTLITKKLKEIKEKKAVSSQKSLWAANGPLTKCRWPRRPEARPTGESPEHPPTPAGEILPKSPGLLHKIIKKNKNLPSYDV